MTASNEVLIKLERGFAIATVLPTLLSSLTSSRIFRKVLLRCCKVQIRKRLNNVPSILKLCEQVILSKPISHSFRQVASDIDDAGLHQERTFRHHMSITSSPEAAKSHGESMTSFECPRLLPFVAYRIRRHQVPLIHKRLQTVIPELGYTDNDAARYVQKSLQRDTQVVFVAQDGHDTPLPHEATMLSMGKGLRVRVYHASRPVTGGID
ncbi:hypothetical protein AC579_3299 [Pseudocercospora musae]|uniref:Uncharacterized protein n=1 Tax=Pseudocercospora musae TaxID=113226 RepID=A0A139I9S7_9PEZI|nr:hypothetical protein AC579_3299 [Pseudocercospora musae]